MTASASHYSAIKRTKMKQEIKNQNRDVLVYGDDHIEGLFYKVTSYDGVVLDEDSQLNNPKLTIKVIASLVEGYGFDLSHEVSEDEIEYD